MTELPFRDEGNTSRGTKLGFVDGVNLKVLMLTRSVQAGGRPDDSWGGLMVLNSVVGEECATR